MNSFLKKLMLCLEIILCLSFFISCEATDKKDARETFYTLESCVNNKDAEGLKKLFNSIGASALDDADVEALFSLFPQGFTLNEDPFDDSLTVQDWVEGDTYGKTILWGHTIINNETGEEFIINGLQCTSDWTNEDLGLIYLYVWAVDDMDDFHRWFDDLEDSKVPKGIVLYPNILMK